MSTRRVRRSLYDDVKDPIFEAFARGLAVRGFGPALPASRLPRSWSPAKIILALGLGVVGLSLALALLALAVAGVMLAAPAYAGYHLVRGHIRRRRTAVPRGTRRVSRESRGLLEMARTPDPLDRYLLAVNEFDRLSAAVLVMDATVPSNRRVSRRIAELTEQAYNLHDAVSEIERDLTSRPTAGGALSGVWELSVATAELWSYCRDLSGVPHGATLAEARAFIGRRTSLLSRRDALVARLRDADLGRFDSPGAHQLLRTP